MPKGKAIQLINNQKEGQKESPVTLVKERSLLEFIKQVNCKCEFPMGKRIKNSSAKHWDKANKTIYDLQSNRKDWNCFLQYKLDAFDHAEIHAHVTDDLVFKMMKNHLKQICAH